MTDREMNWSWLGWVTYGSSRLILVGLGNLQFLQVNYVLIWCPLDDSIVLMTESLYDRPSSCFDLMSTLTLHHWRFMSLTSSHPFIPCSRMHLASHHCWCTCNLDTRSLHLTFPGIDNLTHKRPPLKLMVSRKVSVSLNSTTVKDGA